MASCHREKPAAHPVKTPAVTVAIPCYNAERWIGEAVQSALDQDLPDVEVIVVDDGSTDASREKVRAFGDRVKLLEGGHRGGNAARNTALHAANGEWVQFLDADDYLLPQKISAQLAGAGDEEVIFSPVFFEQDGQRTASAVNPKRSPESLWLAWEFPQTGGCLWRKSALVKIGGWNETTPCCQEYELYSRAVQAGFRFRYAEAVGAVYRVWSDATLCRKDPTQVVAVRTELYRQFVQWMEAKKALTKHDRQLAGRACFEMARTLALEDLTKATRYHRDRRAEGLIHPSGPASPLSYRIAYGLLGFTLAEKIAAARRNGSK
jgi:glycosyltransferase involved in cell wall biosynthesis